MNRKKVVIIGAGVAGIALSARLAKSGYEVVVYEKNESLGGRCGKMEIDGHIFDTGPTLYLMPALYRSAFADLGERVEDHVELLRVDPNYQIFFDDGFELTLSTDLVKMRTQLEAVEPGSYEKYLDYIEEGCRHYRLSLPDIITRDFRTPYEFFNIKNIALLLKLKALTRHHKNIENYFRNDHLKFAFIFQNLYMGLNPYSAPAIYSLMPYIELSEGIWYPRGGLYRVAEALVRIAKNAGVEFVCNAPVEKILTNGASVSGLQLVDGTDCKGDIVVANADLTYVYDSLLPQSRQAKRLQKKKYGCSALSYFWALDKAFPQLKAHNLFMAEDIRSGFDLIFSDLDVSDAPSFYLHAPVRVDNTMAPADQDTLIISVPVPHINESAPQDWEMIRKQTRSYIVKRLEGSGLADIEKHIKNEIVFDPTNWKHRYNLTKGSAHGLGHELLQMGYMRPHNRHSTLKNLYFVGASTHPGTGLPSVLTSAKFAGNRILEELPA